MEEIVLSAEIKLK